MVYFSRKTCKMTNEFVLNVIGKICSMETKDIFIVISGVIVSSGSIVSIVQESYKTEPILLVIIELRLRVSLSRHSPND